MLDGDVEGGAGMTPSDTTVVMASRSSMRSMKVGQRSAAATVSGDTPAICAASETISLS